MPESIFQKFTEQDVSNWVNIFAVVMLILCPACGAVYGRMLGHLKRYLIIGLMVGSIGPLSALSWHIVDARTSYWDHKYQDQNPELKPRVLWPVVGTAKLDSLSNLGILVAGFVIGGTLCGVGAGLTLRWLDRKYPMAPPSVEAPEDSEDEPQEAESTQDNPEEQSHPSNDSETDQATDTEQ